METFSRENSQKSAKEFHCKLCDFHTAKKSDYARHQSTRKHQVSLENMTKETFGTVLETEPLEKAPEPIEKQYCCGNCKKTFKVRSGLWKHKKTCEIIIKPYEHASNNNSQDATLNLVLKVVEQNSQVLSAVNNSFVELAKHNVAPITNTTNNNNNYNNSHNKTFNLNFFLNEECKTAQNITDFINNLQIEFDDLEGVGRLGYVEGISNIIIKSLKNMDVKERPIHCTDLKRETLYIKDADRWNKENEEKEKLRKLIDKVANKNLRTLPKWCDLHPDSEDLDSREYSVFHNIYKNSLGDEGEDEQKKFNEKIIKNISKNVMVSR